MPRHKSIWLLVTCLLILASCATSGNQSAVHTGTQQPTGAATTTPTPVPAAPMLGPVPRNCPISTPAYQNISPNLSQVIGTSPVWAAWPPGPNIFHGQPLDPHSNTYEPPYGWEMTKVVWEVGPNYTHSVTVRGYEISDHTPLLIQFLNNTPTLNGVLDPEHPDHPVSVIGTNWAEWGSYIVVPKAGCYVMEVSWPTGHWSVTFAFGM
jgi:hypothetical protein